MWYDDQVGVWRMIDPELESSVLSREEMVVVMMGSLHLRKNDAGRASLYEHTRLGADAGGGDATKYSVPIFSFPGQDKVKVKVSNQNEPDRPSRGGHAATCDAGCCLPWRSSCQQTSELFAALVPRNFFFFKTSKRLLAHRHVFQPARDSRLDQQYGNGKRSSPMSNLSALTIGCANTLYAHSSPSASRCGSGCGRTGTTVMIMDVKKSRQGYVVVVGLFSHQHHIPTADRVKYEKQPYPFPHQTPQLCSYSCLPADNQKRYETGLTGQTHLIQYKKINRSMYGVFSFFFCLGGNNTHFFLPSYSSPKTTGFLRFRPFARDNKCDRDSPAYIVGGSRPGVLDALMRAT